MLPVIKKTNFYKFHIISYYFIILFIYSVFIKNIVRNFMEQKLKHVYRLQRYLPFDPSHDQIYEEYQSSGSIDIQTKALRYLTNIFDCKIGYTY